MQMNRPSPRLAILRAQLAAEQFGALCQRAEYIISAEQPRCRPAPPPDADSLPLPPDYWSELERWTKTLTPPAASMTPVLDKLCGPADPSNAAQGAAPAAAVTRYCVCVEEHEFEHVLWLVGDVRKECAADECRRPAAWRDCDKDGWIPHVPQADSVCPVPEGAWFEARYGDGSPVACTESTRRDCAILWKRTNGSDPSSDIVAWRPVPTTSA